MVLLIQKEVAQRICAKPPQMSILAVSVQFYSQPKIISHVSKNSFWPVPKVDSAIIEIIPQPAKPDIDPTIFFAIVKAGFVAPRKQLINNLSRSLKIDRAKVEKAILSIGLSPHQRAETLTVEDWKKLAKLLN